MFDCGSNKAAVLQKSNVSRIHCVNRKRKGQSLGTLCKVLTKQSALCNQTCAISILATYIWLWLYTLQTACAQTPSKPLAHRKAVEDSQKPPC